MRAGNLTRRRPEKAGRPGEEKTTAPEFSELDEELKTVREATTLLSTSQSSGAQSFYLHLAEGASPHILLADLKGQMDLLAQQMARHSRP